MQNKSLKKRILKVVLGSSTGLIICGIAILVPILMIYNFFGGEISDSGYVEGNMEYADEYKSVLNKNIKNSQNGYVPLSRILYFYLDDDSLSFSDIYKNNLDHDLKNMKPISEVCSEHYAKLSVCSDDEIAASNQVDEYSYKPFTYPLNFSKATITSFFGQERIVYDEYDIHYAWDFAAPAQTPVYSVYDGKVVEVRFNQSENTINKSNGAGNYITLEYEIDGDIYKVLYGHLYPNSKKVKVGDSIKAGQQIASVGTTGYSTGNHLHFQVNRNGKKIDGMNLIDFLQDD